MPLQEEKGDKVRFCVKAVDASCNQQPRSCKDLCVQKLFIVQICLRVPALLFTHILLDYALNVLVLPGIAQVELARHP